MNKKQTIEVLNDLLLELNLNIPGLADKIGISPQSLYDIKDPNKKNAITPKLADKIISIFPQIDKYYLLTGEGSINKMRELGENASKREIIAAINRATKIVETISESILLEKEANLKSKEVEMKNAETNLLREKNNEKIANSYESNSAALKILAEYLIKKEK